MAIRNAKTHKLMSVCALTVAGLTAFGSVFAVAAAATAPQPIAAEAAAAASDTSVFRYLNESGEYHVLSAHEVEVKNGDESVKVVVKNGVVADAVEAAGFTLSETQVTYPPMNKKITKDTTVRILDAKMVTVTADGKTKNLLLPYGTVEEALTMGGIKLGKEDVLDLKRDKNISKVDAITIKRVTYQNETETEAVPYEKVKENSDELELGESKIGTEGKDGEKAVVRKVKYIDGERDSSEIIAEKIIRKPVDEVTLVGTKGAGSTGGAGTFTDENGVEVSYKYKLTGSGTAYTAAPGAATSTGAAVYEGGVAVNPSLIPYGSKLYIVSTDGSRTYGYATAVDTGGALMDGSAIVDCFYFSYDACMSWGRRDVNVYVIK